MLWKLPFLVGLCFLDFAFAIPTFISIQWWCNWISSTCTLFSHFLAMRFVFHFFSHPPFCSPEIISIHFYGAMNKTVSHSLFVCAIPHNTHTHIPMSNHLSDTLETVESEKLSFSPYFSLTPSLSLGFTVQTKKNPAAYNIYMSGVFFCSYYIENVWIHIVFQSYGHVHVMGYRKEKGALFFSNFFVNENAVVATAAAASTNNEMQLNIKIQLMPKLRVVDAKNCTIFSPTNK